jgi:poly-gamma-glutamate capsule biosynthesis protein CapA/YwtB (metallophosphatase superfamily)
MKRLFYIIILAAASFYLFSLWKWEKPKVIELKQVVTISFVGDLMCHGPQYEYARVQKDSFDFRPSFSEIKKYLASSDITIGNLETVVEGKGSRLSSYPLFNSPIEYLDALKDAGFDVLITSNNHCLDKGIGGIEKTIASLDKYGFNHLGTYKNREDRDSIRIYTVNKIKIALLSYTYGVNGNYIPVGKNYAVNLIDTSLIKKDVDAARKKNADVVLVYFHFGEEYQLVPNRYQKDIVKNTIACGADLIIASHPHSIQPVEYFVPVNGKLDQGIVAYSLGNFISNQRWRYSDCGVILNFTLEKTGKEKIILDTLSILPTWVYKGDTGNKRAFVILPADTSVYNSFPSYITKVDKEKILQSFNDTKRTLISVQAFKRKTSLHTN